MARIALAILKRTSFRGATQHFSNVYHYNVLVLPSATQADALIDEVTATERALHSGAVTFVKGNVWSAGGNKSENQMITEKGLSGVGDSVTVQSFDRERAFLVMWPAGFDSRGLPVYLRKWYHSCGACNGNSPSNDNMANTTELATAARTSIANKADENRVLAAGEYELASETGRTVTGPVSCHRWLEHRQLGDEWRG